jgi:hypothetical protein
MRNAILVLMLAGVLDPDVSRAAARRLDAGRTSSPLSSITMDRVRHTSDASSITEQAAILPAALSLSREVPLGDLRYESGGAAAVAFGLNGGLAVWDARDADANHTEQLMASVITSNGDLENPVGQPLPLPASEAEAGSVAISFLTHSDTGMLAWVNTRGEALAVRIRTEGQLLDPQPLRLPDPNVRQVSVICGDHDCLLLWLQFGDFYGRGPMKGARISDIGALLDPVPLNLGDSQSGLSAVWTGSEYWIVASAASTSPDNGFVRRLQVLPLRSSGLGAPIASIDDVLVGDGSIAWNGFEGLLAWNSMVGAYPLTHNEIRYSRIDGDGRLLDGTNGVLIGTAPPPVSFTDSGIPTPWDGRVTWDGMTFLVTWAGPLGSSISSDATLFERVTSAGQRLDGDFPNAGFSLHAPVPAAIVGVGQGRTVISYEKSALELGFGSRMRVLQQVSGRRRSARP